MDLPIYLENAQFVSGVKEMRQTMKTLLTNYCGSFCQSPTLGSYIAIHSDDEDEVIEGIRETIAQIPGVSIVTCEYKSNGVELVYVYKGEPDNFHFSVETL